MALLIPAQAEALSNALIDAFKPTTLPWVVRSSLGPELYVIVNTAQNFLGVVGELLAWIEHRGPGTLDAFLRGCIAARPNHQALRDFCAQNFPKTLIVLPNDALVQHFTLGLQLLIDNKDAPAVRETVGAFRVSFVTTSKQIVVLKKYKQLHDSLHALQLALDAILDALGRVGDRGAVRTLRKQAQALARWAMTARVQTDGLSTKVMEDNWIDDFDACVKDINDATEDNANPELRKKAAADLPDRLKDILQNLSRINGLLAFAAADLQFYRFTDAMRKIADSIAGAGAAGNDVLQLRSSARAVEELGARIEGLVGEHNDWQVFNLQLEIAERRSKMHRPQARIQKWDRFRAQLTGLCDTYPEAPWSSDLMTRMSRWINVTPSESPDDNEKLAGEGALAELHLSCVYRFFDVDKELNELSGEVTGIAQSLETLLNAVNPPEVSHDDNPTPPKPGDGASTAPRVLR